MEKSPALFKGTPHDNDSEFDPVLEEYNQELAAVKRENNSRLLARGLIDIAWNYIPIDKEKYDKTNFRLSTGWADHGFVHVAIMFQPHDRHGGLAEHRESIFFGKDITGYRDFDETKNPEAIFQVADWADPNTTRTVVAPISKAKLKYVEHVPTLLAMALEEHTIKNQISTDNSNEPTNPTL
jgi:hypothetical protein